MRVSLTENAALLVAGIGLVFVSVFLGFIPILDINLDLRSSIFLNIVGWGFVGLALRNLIPEVMETDEEDSSSKRKRIYWLGILFLASIASIYLFNQYEGLGEGELEEPLAETHTATPGILEDTATETAQLKITSTPGFLDPSGDMALSEFLAAYFDLINNANTKEELRDNWNRLSQEVQCYTENCDYGAFSEFWFSVRVRYEIWECPGRVTDVFIAYYNRDDTDFFSENSSQWVRYWLAKLNNEWFIQSGDVSITEHGQDCLLAATNMPD